MHIHTFTLHITFDARNYIYLKQHTQATGESVMWSMLIGGIWISPDENWSSSGHVLILNRVYVKAAQSIYNG